MEDLYAMQLVEFVNSNLEIIFFLSDGMFECKLQKSLRN